MAEGIYLILMPIIIACGCDAVAYYIGCAFGKHKLAPRVSPNKTVEGSVGGILGAIVFMMIYGLILQFAFKLEVNYIMIAVYALLGSLVAQIGDLSMSLIKREYGIKDFGKSIPGHGGVMDRVDSIMFVAPAVEIMSLLLPAAVTIV